MNCQANEDPTAPYSKYTMLEVGSYQLPLTLESLLAGLELAEDYWVDVDKDGRRDDQEDNDEEEDIQSMEKNISAKDELKDMVFFAIPRMFKIFVIDITGTGTGPNIYPDIYGVLTVKNEQGEYALNIRDMEMSVEDQVLYATDMQKGLVLLDMSISGENIYSKSSGERYLGDIHTSGHSQFGLIIDEELKTAYVGQADKGVDVIKLGNPEIKFVYKTPQGTYREVSKICPSGIKPADNPDNYPDEIYVMGIFPGGIAKTVSGDDKKVYCELWSLNSAQAPLIPWDNNKIKTYIKKLGLARQSDTPTDELYKIFLSDSIRVTIAPDKQMVTETSVIQILSGDIMWVHLSGDFITDAGQQNYINNDLAAEVGDVKPSIRADLIDREENFAFNNVPVGALEKPNSPVNNPAMVSNVMLDTGEFVYDEVDLYIPGRGFDFVFGRTYRSQAICSGVLGWGWDHNYNKRLVELYNGDIIYYDGTGRRERFRVKIQAGTYEAPKGRFAELKRTEDGTFRIVYSEGIIETFDSLGRLIKIQDRNKNKMEFLYNVSGQLSAVMDTMGRLIDFEYYPFEYDEISGKVIVTSGRLMRMIDFTGRIVNFTYKADTGDLWKVETTSDNDKDKADPKFNSRTVTYDYQPNPGSDIKLSHNLNTITDPKGQTSLTVNYDGAGKDKVINHISGDSTVRYELDQPIPSVFDGRNNEKRFTLNNDGHIESISEVTEDGSNPSTGFGYVNGLLQTVTYPGTNKVIYGYNDGLLSTITETPGPDGVEDPEYTVETTRMTSFNYEGFIKNLQSIEYPGGLNQHYTYNVFGQVASEYANMVLNGNTIPMGQTLLYEYHPESNPGGDLPTPESARLLNNSTGGYLRRSTSSFGEILNPNDWGYWENFTYGMRGNLSEMNSYNGISASYSTNIFNQVTFETITSKFKESLSLLSYTGDYGYDKNGNLETETTTSGSLPRSATYKHDLRSNLLSVDDSIQGLTSYTYDKNDNVTSISGPGGTMNFTYNMRDLVHTTTIGDETYIFTYDGNGNMSTFTDPYGYTTTYGYDGYDRLSLVKDPLNNVTLIGRSQFGNLLSLKHLDENGENLLFHSLRINDPLGRMTSYTIKMPDGEDITYTISYEEDGKKIKIKDPMQRESIVEKNNDGRVKKVTDAAKNETEYFYEDGRGNATRVVETVKSADGDKTETYETFYEYNAHNKLEKIIDPQKFETEFYYDNMGNLKGTKDAEENTVTHDYDALGRRTKTIKHFKDGQKIETFFEYYPANTYNPGDPQNPGQYSPSNRLKSITDDKGNKTTYEYDHKNRIKKIIYPDDSFIEYTYDRIEAGTNDKGETVYYRLLIEKQRDGTIVKNYFDQVQRLMKREIIPAEGAVGTTLETFEYDGLSRVNYASDNDSQLDFQYDRASRLDWEKRADKLIDYTYDKLSNLRKIQYPSTRLFERGFDQLNRMNLIKEGNITIADMKHIGRSYRLLRKQYGNGDLIEYLYDQGRRLEYKETRNKNSDLINHYKYGYNKVHMKTFEQRLHDSGKGNVMAYDELYRLTGMKFNVPDPTIENPTTFEKEKAIKYDHLHNILSMVENFNGQTKTITTDIPENSIYSKLNQYASFDQWGLSYDKKGNTTQKGTLQLSYDYRNQLVTASDATSNTQVDMKYDVLGRRIQKAVTIGSQTKIENYYHSGHQVIEVRDENDQLIRQYIYGNGIDEIIRMDKYEGDTFTSYYYHTDANGSVTAITDANGQLVERVTYDIYGMPTFWDADGNVISKSSIGNNILFHGREYDYELNLYYFRARYYDPIMGRFLQTDPMGYQDSLNLYQGFNMSPYNFGDPWGLSLKLSRSEMQQFESNLKDILIELYRDYYDAETADQLIDFVLYHATLENKVWAFNELTDLNLEVPEKLGVLGIIFSTAKSYANFSKKFGAKVKQWLGADKAQKTIDDRKGHWLVKDGVTLPGLITITQQINVAFAEGAADIAEFTVEELQWAVLAGVLKGAKLFYHRHHTIPKEIRKKLPPKIRNHPDIIGRKGLPNRKQIEAGEHLGRIHKGYRGGAYNKRFEEEILKRGGYENVTVDDILEIRDMLVKEFGIKSR